MHYLRIDDTAGANHNGDFTGDVYIEIAGEEEEIVVPMYVMEAIVAAKIRAARIAELEDATVAELLGLTEEECDGRRDGEGRRVR